MDEDKNQRLENKLEELSDERIIQIIEDRILLKELPEDTTSCLFIGDDVRVIADRLLCFPNYEIENIPFSPKERTEIINAYCEADVNGVLFFVESSYKPYFITVEEINTKKSKLFNTTISVPANLCFN